MRVSECARVRHIRPQSEPNPRLRAPPPFSGAPGAGGPVAVGCAGGLGWGGRGEIFDFSIFVFDGPETRYGVRQSWQNKPHLEKRRFRRVPADSRSFVGGTGRPGAVSDPVYTGRCVAVRANTARGCPQAPLTAEKPPSYSPAAHRRPTHSRRPAYTTKLPRSQRITRKRTSCPRDGPQPSSAAACEAGRAVLGLTPRSSR